MKNYKWGIIGPGKIAAKFAEALTLVDGASLGAVASRNEERAKEFAEKFGAERYYNNYEQLAADPEIDAIYIATPHAFHCDQALLCLQHKKPVLCEKPMALSNRQVQLMVDAAREANVFLMEAMWTRFLPSIEKTLELIRDGKLGTIKYVRADLGFKAPYATDNRLFDLAQGGGALLDVGVYPIFLCLLLLGEPDSIHATGTLAKTGADESSHALLSYRNGNTGVISSSLVYQTPVTADIVGTEGKIHINTYWYKNDLLSLHRAGEEPEIFRMENLVNGFEYEIRETMRCIDQGLIESPSMPHSFSLTMSKVMDRIREQIGVRYQGE